MPVDKRLHLDSHCEDSIGHMTFEGELIAETRFDTERILREWLEHDVKHAILNCARLRYIDSAGLSTLLGAMHRYRQEGGDIIMAEMNPSLKSVFEMTSMEKYFKIFASMEEARRHFEQMTAEVPSKGKPKRGETAPGRGVS